MFEACSKVLVSMNLRDKNRPINTLGVEAIPYRYCYPQPAPLLTEDYSLFAWSNRLLSQVVSPKPAVSSRRSTTLEEKQLQHRLQRRHHHSRSLRNF